MTLTHRDSAGLNVERKWAKSGNTLIHRDSADINVDKKVGE